MGAKSKSKKKNGPKGKKARAKAKLEKVWGEHVDEDELRSARTRVGKSRLLPPSSKSSGTTVSTNDAAPAAAKVTFADNSSTMSNGLAYANKKDVGLKRNDNRSGKSKITAKLQNNGYSSTDESDNGDDEENDMGDGHGIGNGGSLAHLLKRIRRPESSYHRENKISQSDDDDVEASDDEASEEDPSDDEMEDVGDDESGNDSDSSSEDDEDNYDNSKDVISEDPYETHFSKPPLPELDALPKSNIVPHTGNNRKVNTSSLLKSFMDVQMSGPLLDSWEKCAKDCGVDTDQIGASSNKRRGSVRIRRSWERFAGGPYHHVRQVLSRNWMGVNKTALKIRLKSGEQDEDDVEMGGEAANVSVGKVFSPVQLSLYPAISRYADVLVTTETRQNRSQIYNLLSFHVLNHVLTSRTRVQRHNRRIKELTTPSTGKDSGSDNDLADEGDDRWRDQGYSRPKVLILFPTRGTCWNFVRQMLQLLGDSARVDNVERFDEEFGPTVEGDNDEASSNADDDEEARAKARRAAVLKQKGSGWNELFGDDVNDDDDFKLGMSLTPNVVNPSTNGKKKNKKESGKVSASGSAGVSVKLFAEFYRSDIILASPIGLKMATTSNDDDEDEESATDADYLSSIDICLVARSDVLLMQNWDHVNGVLDSLNQQPKKITDIDFSRVRNYFLAGQGAHWRQLIVVSRFADPFILSTFRRHAKSVEGQLKMRQKVPSDDASVCNVMVRVKQVFQRVACQTVSEVGSVRLRYFTDHVLPKLIRLKQKHTLIYIPSYFDFVAVRNVLLKQEANFVSITEYARVSEVSRGRARFLQGRKDIMLYTGRAHYFLRHKIKGARHLIFFGLPEYSEFYPAIVNMLNDGLTHLEEDDISRMPMSCLSLFTKFDAHQLERIVGSAHCERMIKGEKSSYMFCS